ncbi:MAG: YggT family protein [Deltaproteobacteria bacterium]|jgi:YggT family protein|nr:YggT family protein [Deltaproteobacteria bacterium]MDH4007029.1 YggT family protein [Desulfuromonadales bacterium]
MDVLISAIFQVLQAILSIYFWIVIGRAVISWVNPDPYNPIVRFLYNATEPVFSRIRRILPLQFGGMDFTPIALLILIGVLQNILAQIQYKLTYGGF